LQPVWQNRENKAAVPGTKSMPAAHTTKRDHGHFVVTNISNIIPMDGMLMMRVRVDGMLMMVGIAFPEFL
jgi:hypothetical protein